MGTIYTCKYYPQVLIKDTPHLDSVTKERIKRAILERLETDPLMYGFPLRGILKPHWKLRVGDYRVLYEIVKNEVHIVVIGNRKEVYEILENRL